MNRKNDPMYSAALMQLQNFSAQIRRGAGGRLDGHFAILRIILIMACEALKALVRFN